MYEGVPKDFRHVPGVFRPAFDLWLEIGLAAALAAGLIPCSAWAQRVTLSPGVRLAIRLDETISTKYHYFGPIIQATLDQDVLDARGNIAIPAGSRIKLAMAQFKRAGHVFGRARLRLRLFSVIEPDGTDVPLDGYATRLDNNHKPGAEGTFHGPRGLGKDAAVDLTAMGTGAGVGAAVGGPWGLPAGAAAGVLTAGVWTVARRGPDLVLPAGTVIEFTLGRPASVKVPERYSASAQDGGYQNSGDDPGNRNSGGYSRPSRGAAWGQGLAIPPSSDLVALLDQLNDPKAVLARLDKVNFRNRPDSDRVFATYLRGVCELQLSKPKKALDQLEVAYAQAKRLNLPRSAQSEIARNLVLALRSSSKNWQASPLMDDPQLQAVLVEPEGVE
ncbi:MAG: hypothetical protein ACRD3T_13915 [Terriglobia bacterium]